MNPQIPTTTAITEIRSVESGNDVINREKMQFENPTKKNALYRLFTLRPKPKQGCR